MLVLNIHCMCKFRVSRNFKWFVGFSDLPRTEHKSWLPAIVYTIKTLLKQHSTHTAEKSTAEKPQDDSLPPCTDFVTTHTDIMFMCDDIKVTLIPTNEWEAHGGSPALYQMCLKQPAEAQPL